MPRFKANQRASIRASSVGTLMESPPDWVMKPDAYVVKSELMCDMCGVKTKALRKHNKGMVCWTCKASTIGIK